MYKLLLFVFFWCLGSGDSIVSLNMPGNEKVDEGSEWLEFLHTLEQTPIDKEALHLALSGYKNLLAQGDISDTARLIIADFSLESHHERLFIINIKERSLEHISLVSHGKNTGLLNAENFSNAVSSHKSSLGFYLTAETYFGKHGLSLRLDGLEKGFNDKARERAIVIHAAGYVSCEFIEKHGRLGRSHGCPALPVENYEDVIHTIKQGSLLFIYAPEEEYRRNSDFVKQSNILAVNAKNESKQINQKPY
ncbi:MAG: murein L,D-transpeptidase catalytic domain family protein [Cyclobacteriaceae bacterium]|nr:murein L,D-transpeptidase catalytic domain family protein [Cyclobacteriaceae bacterium]